MRDLEKNEIPSGVKRKRGRPRKHKPSKPDHPIRREAPQENIFILCNGKPVKNVKELADVIDKLEDSVFEHHVKQDQNHFAAWVKDVIKDAELAEKLAGAKDKKHVQLVLYKHITHQLW